jgi:hypothetical protein
MSVVTVESWTGVLKDMYPRPGDRIKQWVVDAGREEKWERETCPRIAMERHDDNTGTECSNSQGTVPWTWLDHHCCYICGDLHEATRSLPTIEAWLAEKAKRPPIESDRSKYSDEIAPDPMAAVHPYLKSLKGTP